MPRGKRVTTLLTPSGQTETPKGRSIGKSTAPRTEPRKHFWVDVGVKVKVPIDTPDGDHAATASQVLTVCQDAVRKALDDYQKSHKNVDVQFELN